MNPDRIAEAIMRWSGIAVLVGVLLALAFGCASPHASRFEQVYHVPAYEVHVCDWATVKERLNELRASSRGFIPLSPWGFCLPYQRVLYVAGRAPDWPYLETLGHETWHLPELGGPWYHSDKGRVNLP